MHRAATATSQICRVKRIGVALGCLALWLMQAAAAAAPNAAAAAAADGPQFTRPLVLLGEVHDNAAQHALRLAAFKAWLDSGVRPVLALEQFDRDQQARIDRLRQPTSALDAAQAERGADALIAAAGGRGWTWAHYRPFIALALQHQLPIVAANVSRDEARAVMKDGLARAGFDARVPADVLQALAADIEASHCGMLDAATSQRMALAQVARDQFMASVLQGQGGRPVLLLAGNGHVRTDVGAPRWLPAAVRARSVAIGMLEPGDTRTPYDQTVVTAAQARPDPCAGIQAAPGAAAGTASAPGTGGRPAR